MLRTSFHVTETQIGSLRQESAITGLGISEIVRRAIDDYLERVQTKRQMRLDDIDTSSKEWFSLEELDAGLQKRGLL